MTEDTARSGAPGAPPAAALPSDLRFACLGCGRSCTDFDEVPIDAATAARLRRLPLFHEGLHAEAADGALPYVERAGGSGGLVLRTVGSGLDRRCVFLDDARRCAVHAAHGPGTKPDVCRAFPFHAAAAPGGLRATLSFACTAVLRDHGPLVAAEPGAFREELALAAARAETLGADGIRLHADTWLSPAELAPLEAELLAALAAAPDAGAGLVAQARILARRVGLEVPRPVGDLAALRERALRLALDLVARAPGGDADLDARLRGLVRGPAVAPSGEGGAGDAAGDRLLRRFLAHRILRGDLLRGPSVTEAHGLIALGHGLAIAVAEALARARGAGRPALAEIEEGVRAAEQRTGLHATLARDLSRGTASHGGLGELLAATGLAEALAGATRG